MIDTFFEQTRFDEAGDITAYCGPYHATHGEVDAAIAALLTYKRKNTAAEITSRNRNIELLRQISEAESGHETSSDGNDGYLYVIETQGLHKIGRTKYAEDRVKRYRTENPYPVEVVILAFVGDMSFESQLHQMFAENREHGEWYKLDSDDLEAAKDAILGFGGLLVK